MKTTASKPKSSNKPSSAKQGTDVLQELHQDHQRVKELFFQFSQEKDDDEKEELVKTILKELYVHATVEEEIVYPAVREEAEDSEDMMDEADTEHHVVKLLMAELSEMKASDDHFDAKVTVLCELVTHHIREEEKEMFKEITDAGIDVFELGEEVASRKEELKAKPMPAKAGMVKTSSRGNGNGNGNGNKKN